MIIVMKPKTEEEIEKIKCRLEDLGCGIHESKGINYHIFGLIGIPIPWIPTGFWPLTVSKR
jgi:hypothetical protein